MITSHSLGETEIIFNL